MDDFGVVSNRPVVCLADLSAAGHREGQVLQAGAMARVRRRLECLVEKDLRAASASGAVVELAGFCRREPGPKPQDRHELVVIPLGRRKVGNPYADVVDESWPGHLLLLSTLGR